METLEEKIKNISNCFDSVLGELKNINVNLDKTEYYVKKILDKKNFDSKSFLSNEGIGTGTNITISMVDSLLKKYAAEIRKETIKECQEFLEKEKCFISEGYGIMDYSLEKLSKV